MPRHAPEARPVLRHPHAERPAGHRLSRQFHPSRKNVAKLFRARDFDNARSALKAVRAWRDSMTQSLLPETKQEFSLRVKPVNARRRIRYTGFCVSDPRHANLYLNTSATAAYSSAS